MNKLTRNTLFGILGIATVMFFYFGIVKTEAAKIPSSSKPIFQETKMDGLSTNTSRITNKLNFLSSNVKPITLSVPNLDDSSQVTNQFFKDYGVNFGIKNSSQELTLLKEQDDDLGMSHMRYNQIFKGVPVFGAQLSLHLNDDLSVSSAGGNFLPDMSINTRPTISASQAQSTASKMAKSQFGIASPVSGRAQLVIFNESIFNPDPSKNNNILVWETMVTDKEGLVKKVLFTDAKTGVLVYSIDGMKSDVYREVYNCNNDFLKKKCVIVAPSGSRLQDGRAENESPIGYADIDDIYDYLSDIQDYWENSMGRNGANEEGGTGNALISLMQGEKQDPTQTYALGNIKNNCPNAFWNGAYLSFCPNMVTLQTVAHEYMHAISDNTFNDAKTLGLVYKYESGAIEEGMADVFALAVDRSVNGASTWQISAPALGVIRDVADPDKTPNKKLPTRLNDPNFYCGYSDEGGVHYNSTIVSHLFYNLVNGGGFNGCSIEPIDQEAAEKIFYRALKYHFNVAEKFGQLYDDLFTSCTELYGYGSNECNQLLKAMQAAELDQPSRCVNPYGSVKIPSCALPTIQRPSGITPDIPGLDEDNTIDENTILNIDNEDFFDFKW
jgi:Zn-dependent metalloprotease